MEEEEKRKMSAKRGEKKEMRKHERDLEREGRYPQRLYTLHCLLLSIADDLEYLKERYEHRRSAKAGREQQLRRLCPTHFISSQISNSVASRRVDVRTEFECYG